jgi:hypothetical protein
VATLRVIISFALIVLFSTTTSRAGNNPAKSTISTFVSIPDGALLWNKLVKRTPGPSPDLQYSESLVPSLPGLIVSTYNEYPSLMFKIDPSYSCRYQLTIGGISGKGYSAYSIYINNNYVGEFPSGSGKLRAQSVTLATPALHPRDNILELKPQHRDRIALCFLHLSPVMETVAASAWKIKTGGADAEPMKGSGSETTLAPGEVASCWMYTPSLARDYRFRLSSSSPVILTFSDGLAHPVRVDEQGLFTIRHNQFKAPFVLLNVAAKDSRQTAIFTLAATTTDERFLPELPTWFQLAQNTLTYPRQILRTASLQAEVALFAKHNGYYRGGRFERAGTVYSLRQKDTEFFTSFTPERNPLLNDNVGGTAGEFRDPLGYDQAAVGEEFIKIGVGRFIKSHARQYSVSDACWPVEIFDWQQRIGEHDITFTQRVSHNGWGYEYSKVISLSEQRQALIIRYRLKNTGTKAIRSNHYCHNFTSFNRLPITHENYLVANTAFTTQFPTSPAKGVRFNGNRMTIAHSPSTTFSRLIPEEPLTSITLCNNLIPTALRIIAPKPLQSCSIYIDSRVICPEFFVAINLDPSEECSWQREWQLLPREK